MKNVLRMPALFDLYGSMFTSKQREFFILYYHYDLSLGEIAEEHDVTRQAIHDTIKRMEIALEDFENKLGLLEYQEDVAHKLKEISQELSGVRDLCKDNSDVFKALETIQESIAHIIKG